MTGGVTTLSAGPSPRPVLGCEGGVGVVAGCQGEKSTPGNEEGASSWHLRPATSISSWTGATLASCQPHTWRAAGIPRFSFPALPLALAFLTARSP